jgi:hypothetical protein
VRIEAPVPDKVTLDPRLVEKATVALYDRRTGATVKAAELRRDHTWYFHWDPALAGNWEARFTYEGHDFSVWHWSVVEVREESK